MKTIAAAALGLSLLAGSTVFAQDSTATTKKETKVKHKKDKKGATTSTTEKSEKSK
jgi:hypothetical protein